MSACNRGRRTLYPKEAPLEALRVKRPLPSAMYFFASVLSWLVNEKKVDIVSLDTMPIQHCDSWDCSGQSYPYSVVEIYKQIQGCPVVLCSLSTIGVSCLSVSEA